MSSSLRILSVYRLVLCLAVDCWLLAVGRLLFVVDRIDGKRGE